MPPVLLSLPPEQLALLRIIAAEASARKLPAYMVGGFVRDLLLKHPGLDLDIVVEGDAPALARALARTHGGKLTVHKKFGTATWIVDYSILDIRSPNPENRISTIDFITARRETYAVPAALPDVIPSTLSDDLRRRDFSINTLAVRLDRERFGELVDEHRAASDLQHGLIRVLHDASFIDDPTRMFRAVRYEQRYGFRIEAHTLALLRAALGGVSLLSSERVRHELDVIFDQPRSAHILARLERLGLLKAVSPALPWSPDTHARLQAGLRGDPAAGWGLPLSISEVPLRRILGYCLWLLDLSLPDLEQLQARLAFPAVTLKAMRATAALRADLATFSGAPPSKWVDRLDGIPLSAVYAVALSGAEPALETYALRWRHIQPRTDGNMLKAYGVAPGPAYKKILHRLRAAWLDGEVASGAQEQELLERLLAAN